MRRLLEMDFRRTYFLLPNLFTLAGMFCGLYAVSLCARLGDEGSDQDLLYKAALAIIVGLVFDATDGRIARLTRTQSELGLNLDSLTDVVTFGVAPALLIYRWGLEDLGRIGLVVAFVFLACGALRLARFNVISLRGGSESTPKKYMLGLPIPMAANLIVGLVIVNHAIGVERAVNHTAIAAVVLVLAYLMISRVRFRSMKDVRMNRRTIGVGALVLVIAVIVAARIHAPAVFLMLIATYIGLGLLEEVLFYRRRRRMERGEDSEPAEADDQVVLRELGIGDPP